MQAQHVAVEGLIEHLTRRTVKLSTWVKSTPLDPNAGKTKLISGKIDLVDANAVPVVRDLSNLTPKDLTAEEILHDHRRQHAMATHRVVRVTIAIGCVAGKHHVHRIFERGELRAKKPRYNART